MFLDPAAPGYYRDWERTAADNVAILRTEAGRAPHDKALQGQIGELSTRSETFAARRSAPAGPTAPSDCTAPASDTSATPSSANPPSTSTRWNRPPTPA